MHQKETLKGDIKREDIKRKTPKGDTKRRHQHEALTRDTKMRQ